MKNYKAYEQKVREGAVVTLESENASVQIAPVSGFKVFSVIYKNRQMLMPTASPFEGSAANGIPVLFPFPNRTKDARYSFGGHDCVIAKNGEERFIHGLMIDEPFAYSYGVTENSAWCTGVASITPDKEYFASYPFPCTLRLTYTLSEGKLRLDYKVTNDGMETLPYGLAIHPYFNKFESGEDVTITVPVDSYYEAEKCFPSGNLLPAEGDFDLRPVDEKKGLSGLLSKDFAYSKHTVASYFLDTVYHGLSEKKQALVHYEKLGLTLALRASDEFKNMVVFTPPMLPGFCLENQTNATDYINLYNAGCPDACMNTVGVGQTKGGYIEVTVHED